MIVKRVIEMLQKQYNADEHIMIDWVDQENMHDRMGDDISDKLWIDSCNLADDSEYLFDTEMAEIIIIDAQEKIQRDLLVK